MFVFWEGVGLGSYLLIGFWFHKPSAANAAKKAFIVTRLGDFGFLAAILDTLRSDRHLRYRGHLQAGCRRDAGRLDSDLGGHRHFRRRRRQIGPVPAACLAAGRHGRPHPGQRPDTCRHHGCGRRVPGCQVLPPIFEHSAEAMLVVAVIGAFTAIFAASMGLVMNDIKRVLAYSTISQLGYMMLGLGVGGVAIGIFHLFTHAFFKALLFLGSGSVNHGTGTFDMRLMGGLRKVMPWTYVTFLIGSLSLAGIWPLAGFWSKDEILVSAFANNPWLFALAIITVFMTAFYMFRAVFMTFHGEYKGGAPATRARRP